MEWKPKIRKHQEHNQEHLMIIIPTVAPGAINKAFLECLFSNSPLPLAPYYTHHSVWKYGLYRHCVFPSMASLLCLVMSGIFHITVPLGVTAFNSSSPVQVCLGGDGWSSIGGSVVLGCIWSSEIWGNINTNILQSSVFKNDTQWASIHV